MVIKKVCNVNFARERDLPFLANYRNLYDFFIRKPSILKSVCIDWNMKCMNCFKMSI